METIKIKNFYFKTIGKVLNYNMPFNKSRIKNRFLKIISDKSKDIEKSRIEILESFTEKDDKGKPIIEDNSYKLSDENKAKWAEEYQKLMEEDTIIDLSGALKVDLSEIKQMINNSTVELSGQETAIVEDVLNCLGKSEKKVLKTKNK